MEYPNSQTRRSALDDLPNPAPPRDTVSRETVLPESSVPQDWAELECLEQAGATLRRRTAADLLKQGLIYYYDRDLKQALNFLKQAQAIYWELGDPEGCQKALTILGLACYGLNDYANAIDYSQRALSWSEKLGNLPACLRLLGTLGNAQRHFGQL
jgi:tetratricopeptide (TPR) repeat protein